MIWIIIILTFAALITLLMLTPIHIIINSEEDEFLRAKYGILKAGIRRDDEELIAVRIAVPGAGYTFFPLKKKERKEVTEKKERKERESSGRSAWSRIKMFSGIAWQITTGFRVSRLYLDIDTRNVILNANLYPLFVYASTCQHIDLNINYTGDFKILLDVRNNLFSIISVIIRNLFKNYKT